MHRWRVLASFPCAVLVWCAACGGKAVDDIVPSGVDASPTGDSGPGEDGGLAPGCPASSPTSGDACTQEGLVCTYASDMTPCGTFTCDSDRLWQGGFPGGGCPLPPGLVCPRPDAPELTGTPTPVDRTCGGDGDCASVVFETDCCGSTLAFGVNTSSASVAMTAAATCARTFPGCGCAARETVPETLPDDAGVLPSSTTIEAYCAAGTCKTRYR